MNYTPESFAVCSWSLRPTSPQDLADKVIACGLNALQLHLNPIHTNPGLWGDVGSVLKSRSIRIVSGMFNIPGEDYSTLESIRRTGGLVPDKHWDANWKIIQKAAQAAADLGLSLVSSHVGFIPEHHDDPVRLKLFDRVRQVAACFARHHLTYLFETGQETAITLESFLTDLHTSGVTNIGVNFDPANMILYDKGDPIAALLRLLPYVRQVHIKDALRTKTPGSWGAEKVVGEGEVDWRAFFRTLNDGNFLGRGPMVIEREGGDNRIGDVRRAVEYLAKLTQ